MTKINRNMLPAMLLAACGVWLMCLGVYFLALRPPLLPEDFRYIGISEEALSSQLPRVAGWLKRVFSVMGGFMFSTGVLTFYFGWHVDEWKSTRALTVITLSVVSGVGLMSIVNFVIASDFRWLLVVPAAAGLIGCILLYSTIRTNR